MSSGPEALGPTPLGPRSRAAFAREWRTEACTGPASRVLRLRFGKPQRRSDFRLRTPALPLRGIAHARKQLNFGAAACGIASGSPIHGCATIGLAHSRNLFDPSAASREMPTLALLLSRQNFSLALRATTHPFGPVRTACDGSLSGPRFAPFFWRERASNSAGCPCFFCFQRIHVRSG